MDIRWIQRYSNFIQALDQLSEFVNKGQLSKFEKQGLIQCFEYNYELAWNTIKDLFESQGEQNILGSKDAFRIAFKRGLIKNGETWMKMVTSRNLTSHTYHEALANQVVASILTEYYIEFKTLRESLKIIADREVKEKS